MIKRKMPLASVFIPVLSIMVFFIQDWGYAAPGLQGHGILEKTMKVELIQRIGSDKENEDFFRPESFALSHNGCIYILDSGNSRIQCFSHEGKFLFGFGKRGQGPGELSNSASTIKILEDGKIYVIDNLPHRINIYSQEGKFIRSEKISRYYDDIVFAKSAYYLSGILLQENFKPVDFMTTLGKVDGSFGILFEPSRGIIKEISTLSNPAPWRNLYMGADWTSLLADKDGNVIFSQENPYELIKYSPEGHVLKEISGEVGFDPFVHLKFLVRKDGVSVSSPNRARIIGLSSIGQDRIAVPYTNPEENLIFVDIYDYELNLVSRHKMANTIVNSKKKDYFKKIVLDGEGRFYGLVRSEEESSHLDIYKLILD